MVWTCQHVFRLGAGCRLRCWCHYSMWPSREWCFYLWTWPCQYMPCLWHPKSSHLWSMVQSQPQRISYKKKHLHYRPITTWWEVWSVLKFNKVKNQSDGTLDKLKNRIIVCGDLQSKEDLKDKWSHTASFSALKMFLAHACHLKVHVHQLKFVGPYLQANVHSCIFI